MASAAGGPPISYSGDLGEGCLWQAGIILECTGYLQMLLEAGPRNVRHRITCLTGVSADRRRGRR